MQLATELERNPFAFWILQTMGVRHLHLFHIKIRDRQKLCEMLQIEFTESSGINPSSLSDLKEIGCKFS